MSNTITPTQVTLVPQVQPIPFAQMEQQKEIQHAIGDAKMVVAGGGQGADFQGLMPAWMMAAGVAYDNEEKFNSSSGQMGQFVQAAAKLAVLEQSFTQAVQQLQSFGALKSWLDSSAFTPPKGPTIASASALNTFEAMLKSQVDNFKTNGDKPQQNEAELTSEFNITCSESSAFGSLAQSTLSGAQSLQKQQGGYVSDQGTVGDFIAQMAQTLMQGNSQG